MTDFRRVTDDFSVAPQIGLSDVAEVVRLGFTTLINNRPDGEDPAAPQDAEIEAAAKAAGLEYAYIPVRATAGPADVEAMRQAVDAAAGPVLAYCRSGNRSIVTWSIGQAMSGAMSRGELVSLAREAGYDLSGVLGG